MFRKTLVVIFLIPRLMVGRQFLGLEIQVRILGDQPNALEAQLDEWRFTKPRVAGSSPAQCAKAD